MPDFVLSHLENVFEWCNLTVSFQMLLNLRQHPDEKTTYRDKVQSMIMYITLARQRCICLAPQTTIVRMKLYTNVIMTSAK